MVSQPQAASANSQFTLALLTEHLTARFRELRAADESAAAQCLRHLSALSLQDALDVVYGAFLVEMHGEMLMISRNMWRQSYLVQMSKVLISVEPISKAAFYGHGVWMHTLQLIGSTERFAAGSADAPNDEWFSDLVRAFMRELGSAPVITFGVPLDLSHTGVNLIGSCLSLSWNTATIDHLTGDKAI